MTLVFFQTVLTARAHLFNMESNFIILKSLTYFGIADFILVVTDSLPVFRVDAHFLRRGLLRVVTRVLRVVDVRNFNRAITFFI